MFGYIKPTNSELKVRQHEAYKATYCGLCKSLGKNSGQLPRLGLQYDMASFAFLLCELADIRLDIRKENCVIHPINRRNIAKDNDILAYCAHVTTLLSYNKFQDMWLDEKAIYAPLGIASFKHGYKKAQKKYELLDKKILDALNELHEYEDRNEKLFDYPAKSTADIMEAISENAPIENEEHKRIIANMMRNLGIWIYLADAVEDVQDDIKKKNYNPFIVENDVDLESINLAKEVMTYSLVQATKARDLLHLKDAGDLMDNIIYISLPQTMDRIFAPYTGS